MSNTDKPAWLVPISRVVNHAVQPGTVYVNANNQAEAIVIARGRIDADGSGAAGVEWEPVDEIQDAQLPTIAHDLTETDVLPVDDTPRPLRSPSPDMQPGIIISATAAEETVEVLNEVMDELEKPSGDYGRDRANEMRIGFLAEVTEALNNAIVAHHDPQRRGTGNLILVGTLDETGDGDDEDASAAEPLETEAGQ